MDSRKILLVIFDGLGDRPLTELGHKTPLEATPKPNLDWFAANGINGLVDPIAPGIVAGSDTSHLALFGYDPHDVYTGRGPFEAAGVGIDLLPGDIAFRGNFASVDSELKLTDRRAGRIREGTEELAKAVDGMKIGRIKVTVRAGTEHRVAVVFRGRALSPKVTDTDPHEIGETILEAKPLESAAKPTAKAVNAFTKQAYKLLKDHSVNRARIARHEPPANAIVLRGAGVYPEIVPITERLHLKAAGIAGVALIRGMFRTVGMDVIDVPGATGGLDTDMTAKADAALDALQTYDLVVLHVKAPDLCGHDGKASEKIRVIERMDAMMGHLKGRLGSEVVVAITADHSTPVALKDHSGDPVPLTIFGEGVRVDGVLNFDERSVAAGALGTVRGLDVMNVLLSVANHAEKYGA
ncbi:MAG TPA: 2,3-bisphosphoglycerate-independent phosphoglycerate mutase [Thermoplasmata archaeon]|nr:2,3-bisphosphoglycerate-independent phosphoglycerate mutase [Thermoplasmata archaeon]